MKLVHGIGPQPSSLMIVGEAPGPVEVREDKPFCGRVGVELDNLLMKMIQVSRDDCFVTNMVRYQLPDGQKHISHEDWDMFSTMLKQDIINTQPSVILSLGAIASRFFMSDGPPQRTHGKKHKSLDDGEDITDTSGTWWTVETINAMPHWYHDGDYKCIVIPCYHPTAALKDPSRYPWLEDAFMAVREALRGNLVPLSVASPTCVSDTELNLGSVVAIDTELYANGSLYTVQASSYEGESTVILAGSVPGHRMLSALADHVSDPSVTTLLHNAMFDLPLLAGAGIHPSHWIDTMQVAFLLQTLPLGLKQLAYRLLNLKMRKYSDVVGDYPDLSFVGWNNVLEYAGTDPDATLRVFNAMLPMWYDRMGAILDRDMGIQPMIMSMMNRGLLLDTKYVQDVHGDFVVRMLELRAKIEKYAWEGFNPGSGDQLAKLLYDQLGLARGKNLRKTKATDKKPSRYKTDAKTLKKLIGSHPIIDLTKQWKEVKDLATKYTGVLPSLVNGDGRIHAKISMIRVPHSGRLAISQPNLMAQPSKTEDGLRIRNCYVAPPGYKLVAIDQSQIEVRVMAHVSQDEQLLWAFRNDIDIHTASAMAAFRLPTADMVQPRQRKAAKAVTFGVIYGISGKGLAETIGDGWTENQCDNMIYGWFQIYMGVKQYIENVITHVKRYGWIEDLHGRRTRFPDIKSAYSDIREAAGRKAVNQTIQGGAQGIIKQSMVDMTPIVMEWKRWDLVHPLLQIHDELLFEVREDFIDVMVPVVMYYMENAVKLSIPTTVECKVGERWGSMKKWEG